MALSTACLFSAARGTHGVLGGRGWPGVSAEAQRALASQAQTPTFFLFQGHRGHKVFSLYTSHSALGSKETP